MMTDEAIIQHVLAGEHELFATLVDRYGERVLGLIARLVADEADVEDLAQETFVQAYSSLPQFRGDATFASWLYRIAYNNAMQRLRKQRLRTLPIDSQCDDIADDAVDIFFADDSDERLPQLIEALSHLPPTDQAIVELFYFEDLSLRDIAQALGMTETAVSTKLYRLRKRLYKMMKTKN